MVGVEMDLPSLNDYLKSVIDLIPAHSYFKQPNHAEDENKKKAQKRTNSTQEEKVTQKARKMMVKKRKMDPSFMKTTSAQIVEDIDDDIMPKQKGRKVSESDADSTPSLSILQKRLRDKISEIKAQRNPKNKTPEELEKVRAKRKKERLKMKSKKKLKQEQTYKTGSTAAEMQGKPGQKHTRTDMNSASRLENSEGKAVFSKFDFGKEIESKKQKKERKNKSRKENDLVSLLAQAENKKQKIKHLKETNPDEAESVIKKENWGKALAKAEGTKIKDDPELLRKSIKKEKAIKRQHAKQWKEREKKVQEKMQVKQKKREENIKARKSQVKNKKMAKRAKKFAKSVPGF